MAAPDPKRVKLDLERAWAAACLAKATEACKEPGALVVAVHVYPRGSEWVVGDFLFNLRMEDAAEVFFGSLFGCADSIHPGYAHSFSAVYDRMARPLVSIEHFERLRTDVLQREGTVRTAASCVVALCSHLRRHRPRSPWTSRGSRSTARSCCIWNGACSSSCFPDRQTGIPLLSLASSA